MSAAARALLEDLFAAALAAVRADVAVDRAIDESGDEILLLGEPVAPRASLHVLALGKAACSMAARFEDRLASRIVRGLCVTKDGHALPLARCDVMFGAHPVPDARSQRAAEAALAFAASVPRQDELVVLLSGGASALVGAACEGLSLADLAATNAALLASGASIDEVNAVRKHIGLVGGGRLAAASTAARISLLAISDVPGDRLDVIGSGPCSGDGSTYRDALAVLERRGLGARVPARVVALLEAGARGERPETLAPGTAALARVRARVVARNADARAAVAARARELGWNAIDAGEWLEGEARDVGASLVDRARTELGRVERGVVAFGGETTVTIRGDGRGGRNQELALAAALAGDGRGDFALLAAGTDGQDGTSDAAGACVDGATVSRARALEIDAGDALARNDAHAFFAREGGALRTGPTLTNVMDLAIVVIGA